MEKKDMIQALIEHYCGGNKTQFAAMLGVKPQTINSWISRNTFDGELIYAKCVGVSADWLMIGRGEMLRSEEVVITKPQIKEKAEMTSPPHEMLSQFITALADKDNVIREQAEEIGRLREQVRQLKLEKGRDASDATTSTHANVG